MRETTSRALIAGLTLALIFWGGFTTIAYLGVPAHQAELLGSTQASSGCADGNLVCGGLHVLGQALVHAVGRWIWSPQVRTITPFFWCAAVVLLATTGVRLSLRRRPPATRDRVLMSPARIAAAFLAVVWILFTAMSLGSDGDMPYRRLFEPTPAAYPGAGADALTALRENFDALQARGCLSPAGEEAEAGGATSYDLSMRCMQQAFVTRVAAPLAVVSVLALIALGLGGLLIRQVAPAGLATSSEALLAISAGSGILMASLWILAEARVFTRARVAMLLVALGSAGGRSTWTWIRRLLNHRWSWRWQWSTAVVVCLAIGCAALNLLSVIRPFPIGWDDLALYLNKPRLLVSYGGLIPQMGTFQWEYLTAIGFALFGAESAFGATAALVINWSASLFAALAVLAGARLVAPRAAPLATLLYLVLPVIGQVSFADLKIDNAVFAVGTAAFVAACLALVPGRDEAPLPAQRRLLVLAGGLAGLTFSMKATGVMLVLGLAALVAGPIAGPVGFVALASAGGALLVAVQLDAHEVSARLGLADGSLSSRGVAGVLAAIGFACAVLTAWRRPQSVRPAIVALAAFGVGLLLATTPWLAANNLAAGSGRHGLLLEPPNDRSAIFDLAGTQTARPGEDVRSLPPDLRMDIAACRATGKAEEGDRYFGRGPGLMHFLTLPWRVVMNLDISGYHVSTAAAVLLSPLVLLLPWFWTPAARPMRWLVAVSAFLLIQWIVFGNGVPWYGIALFFGIVVAVAALVSEAPTPVCRGVAATLVSVSILVSLSQREGQYQTMRHHYDYMIGKASPAVVAERVVPHYDNVRDLVLARAAAQPARPFALRIGTFVAYFVPRNLGVMPVADNQLDLFSCLNQERNAPLTLGRLQALGFNSIIFDTAVATIEGDPSGPLHRKAQAFLDFVNTPGLGLQVVVNDIAGGIAFLLLP